MVIMPRYQRGYVGSTPANRSTTIRTINKKVGYNAKKKKTQTRNTRKSQKKV